MANSIPRQVLDSNSNGCSRNRVFRNVAAATNPVKTIYVGGQGAVDASGRIVSKGNMQRQAEQVLDNLQLALSRWSSVGECGRVESVPSPGATVATGV